MFRALGITWRCLKPPIFNASLLLEGRRGWRAWPVGEIAGWCIDGLVVCTCFYRPETLVLTIHHIPFDCARPGAGFCFWKRTRQLAKEIESSCARKDTTRVNRVKATTEFGHGTQISTSTTIKRNATSLETLCQVWFILWLATNCIQLPQRSESVR